MHQLHEDWISKAFLNLLRGLVGVVKPVGGRRSTKLYITCSAAMQHVGSGHSAPHACEVSLSLSTMLCSVSRGARNQEFSAREPAEESCQGPAVGIIHPTGMVLAAVLSDHESMST